MKRAAFALLVLLALVAALLFRRHAQQRAAQAAAAVAATVPRAPTRPRAGDRDGDRPRPLRLSAATATAVDAAAAALGGRVLSTADGKPVPQAQLTFLHGGAALSVESDAAGKFAIAPAPAGAYELTAALADGFVAFEPQLGHSPLVIFARAGVRIDDANIYLTPTLPMTVHVRDGENHPLAAVALRAISSSGRAAPGASVISDDKGDARVSAEPDGIIEATKVGYKRARQRISYAMQTTHTMTLTLTRGTDAPLATIAGRVVDARGQPVDGALVEGWPSRRADNAPDRTQTLSGADGRFVLADLEGARFGVRASARGLGSAQASDVAADTRDLELTLRAPAAGLRGVVRDTHDHPVTAFSIVAWPRVGLFGRGHEVSAAVVDAEGRYQLELPPGSYDVRVAANGFATSDQRAVTVADETVSADFQLTRGGRITGRVTDRQTGAPIAGANVAIEGDGAGAIAFATDNSTGADGSFRVDGVGDGAHSIAVQAEGHDGRIVSGLRVPVDGELGPLSIDLQATAPGEDPKTELVGIGAILNADPAGMIVVQVMPGGGAAGAGILVGDRVTAIDGQSVDQMGFGSAIQLIRGPENSVVSLTVDRAGTLAVVPVVRKRITT